MPTNLRGRSRILAALEITSKRDHIEAMKRLSDRIVERLREELDLPDLASARYESIRRIGAGGMGTVYLAHDSVLRRSVALKVMNLADANGSLAERIRREARIAALLEHPSIVPIHDVGVLSDGRVFYVMKLVQGKRLDEYVKSDASLPDLLRIFQRICEAVAFAHTRRVIHRDLKPENIMAGAFGEVLVMDWGVAKVLTNRLEPTGSDSVQSGSTEAADRAELRRSDEVTTLPLGLAPGGNNDTAAGTVIGTPAYMAPEQARGETDSVDERSDIYALGGILYFLLTGRPPREHDFVPSSAGTVGSRPQSRISDRKIPRPLEAMALKATAPVREDRYQNASDLADDIIRYLEGRPVSAYRENILEIAGRWLNRNQVLVLLILAYLLMRLIVFFSFRT